MLLDRVSNVFHIHGVVFLLEEHLSRLISNHEAVISKSEFLHGPLRFRTHGVDVFYTHPMPKLFWKRADRALNLGANGSPGKIEVGDS